MLVSLVGAFELLLSDILHLYYSSHPEALASSDDKFTFHDVLQFRTVDEFKSNVIEGKVDSILRESLEKWCELFKRHKIDLTTFTPSWPAFTECFQRRHIIIHNGAKVSRQYLNESPQNGCSIIRIP